MTIYKAIISFSDYGTGCVIRVVDLEDLTKLIEANLGPDREDLYNINRVNLSIFELGQGEHVEPPVHCFTKLSPGKAILRSLYSEMSPKYGINSGKQTLPMCLTALAFNRLKPAADWTKADIDEILNKGDQLYLQTMKDIQKAEIESQLNETEGAGKMNETNKVEENNVFKQTNEEGSGETLASRSFNVRTDNVKKEFNIGLNKFEVEFEDIREGKKII